MQNNSEVLIGLVVGHKRDGRCRYDPQVKQDLIRQCMMPGVSVARMAMQHGINAASASDVDNQVSKQQSHHRATSGV